MGGKRNMDDCNGVSAIPSLMTQDAALATEVDATIGRYSVAPTAVPGVFEKVELTSGFRLLGTPVGSAEFAIEFFDGKLSEVRSQAAALTMGIDDAHTRLRIFIQCTIQKLPHLLGADIMHCLPLATFKGENWLSWGGPLVEGIDSIIHDFLATLLGRESLPDYSLLIAQLRVGSGGLGILYPSQRAAPDFVLTMKAAMKYAAHGFQFNSDLNATRLHPSISRLFDDSINTESIYLQRFHLLAPHIADVAVSIKCPPEQRLDHFLSKVSTNSARSRIKLHCNDAIRGLLYKLVQTEYPAHLRHLPSTLSPHM